MRRDPGTFDGGRRDSDAAGRTDQDRHKPRFFRSWWRECRAAGVWFCGGAAAFLLMLGLCVLGPGASLLVLAGAGIALLLARPSWHRGRARRLGKRIERSPLSGFERLLPCGWSIDYHSPLAQGVGDVNLLIHNDRYGFVVELKSWPVWDRADSNPGAVSQAKELLQTFAGHEGRMWQAVIWLPAGAHTRIRIDNDVIVVAGSRRSLVDVLQLVTAGAI